MFPCLNSKQPVNVLQCVAENAREQKKLFFLYRISTFEIEGNEKEKLNKSEKKMRIKQKKLYNENC